MINMDQWVSVHRAASIGEAHIVKSMLESRGIIARILDQHMATIYSPLMSAGIDVQVLGADAPIAQAILKSDNNLDD